jgi:hypothetical protein
MSVSKVSNHWILGATLILTKLILFDLDMARILVGQYSYPAGYS